MGKEEPEYLLKMVQQLRRADRGEVNGIREAPRDYIGYGEDHALSFKIKDVVDFAPEAVSIASQDRRKISEQVN